MSQPLVGPHPKAAGQVGSARPENQSGIAPFCAISLPHAQVLVRPRQVIAKAEWLVKGDNPRFVVTNLPKQHDGSIHNLYEKLYCARGDMENRINEQQLYLFADRTSCSQIRANQFRLYLSSFAYVLMQALRWLGLKGAPFANAQCSTLRVKLFKNLCTGGCQRAPGVVFMV